MTGCPGAVNEAKCMARPRTLAGPLWRMFRFNAQRRHELGSAPPLRPPLGSPGGQRRVCCSPDFASAACDNHRHGDQRCMLQGARLEWPTMTTRNRATRSPTISSARISCMRTTATPITTTIISSSTPTDRWKTIRSGSRTTSRWSGSASTSAHRARRSSSPASTCAATARISPAAITSSHARPCSSRRWR